MEKKEKTFEENLQELETIVKKLESGDVPLNDAIASFTEAMKLAKECDKSLKKAEEKITKLVNDDGEIKDFKLED